MAETYMGVPVQQRREVLEIAFSQILSPTTTTSNAHLSSNASPHPSGVEIELASVDYSRDRDKKRMGFPVVSVRCPEANGWVTTVQALVYIL